MEEAKKEEGLIPTTFILRNCRWECFYCGMTLDPDNDKEEHRCPSKKLPVGSNYDSDLEK
jgi:hypothetical protein